MKIAMIGHKDFPSRSGGVEVVVYELASRLAKRDYDVTVYNRGKQKGHNRYEEEGVKIVRSFTFQKQSLNAMVYSFTATLHALFRKYDVVHYHAIGPCVPLLLAHIFGKKTVATIHGLNWKVDKWNSFASKYLKLGEKIAAKYADEVVTLSDEMYQYFVDTYHRETTLIKNAVTPVEQTDDSEIKQKFGLEKGSYIFYVGRISPEKGPQDLIAAYKKMKTDKKLVIAGVIPDNEFGDEIRALIGEDENIICTGFTTGATLHSLYCNCAVYVLPSHTEGLALTLLEAMSCGANVLVSDIVENTSVVGDMGRSFKVNDTDDLAAQIEAAVKNEPSEDDRRRQIDFIARTYGYDRVIDEHIKMYNRVAGK